MTSRRTFILWSVVLQLSVLTVAADAAVRDGIELLNGTVIDGQIVLEDHHGRVVLRSPHSGMGWSFARNHVHAMTKDGQRAELNAKRTWTEEERNTLPKLQWADSGAGQNPLPAYATQEWPRARLLVWANPGKDGSYNEPASWLEDGKPATAPPDKDTDLLFTAAPKRYVIRGSQAHMANRDNPAGGLKCRHTTIETNATVGFSGWMGLGLRGNVHIHQGANLVNVHIEGPKHTVFRNDNSFPKPGDTRLYGKNLRDHTTYSGTYINHKTMVTKYKGASVEFLGCTGIGDELFVNHGKMIIGPDSEFRFNGNHAKGSFEVFDGATLELQSGATIAPFHHESVTKAYTYSIYRGATIQAGSPERPLTKDAHLLLGLGSEEPGSRLAGLMCSEGSKMHVYSTDPTKARLVVSSITSRADFHDSMGNPMGDPDTKAEGTSRGIEVHLAGDMVLDGIAFDYVRLGGIGLLRPEMKDGWRNVSLGSHNAADSLDKLTGKMLVTADEYGATGRVGDLVVSLDKMTKETGNLQVFKPSTFGITTRQVIVSPFHRGVKDRDDGRYIAAVGETVPVTLSSASGKGEIRYTLDGSEPKSDSALYSAPIPISKNTTFKAKCFLKGIGGKTATVEFVFDDPVPAATPKDLRSGLRYRLYKWPAPESARVYAAYSADGPVFSEDCVVEEGTTETLAVMKTEPGKSVGILLTGYIAIPKTGSYALSAQVGGGCTVHIAGQEVTRAVGPAFRGRGFMDPVKEKKLTGRIALAKGKHAIRVAYAEWTAGYDEPELRVYCEGPDMEKQEIPASMLFHGDAETTST